MANDLLTGTENFQPSVDMRYMYYEFLHFIPESEKDKYWAAQVLLFNKMNSEPLVDMGRAQQYRDLDKIILNAQQYKNIIDPRQPDGTGGKAEFFASDWKANPIDVHLSNILEARLDKLGLTITVNAADEFSQTNKQKENAKIMGRRKYLEMLNEFNRMLGVPELREDQDPYQYAEQMQAAIDSGQINEQALATKTTAPRDLPVTLLDNIRMMVEDNEDLALYNEYVYKDGCEIACEVGAAYYMEVNKFPVISDKMKSDIRNFNAAAMRFYTSETTGRPVLRYMDPANTFTQPFSQPDGSDCGYFWEEYDITFGEFVREFGAELTKEQLRDAFERNRVLRGGYGNAVPTYDICTPLQREQTLIRVGWMACQTQNMAVYGYGNIRGNFRYRRMKDDWEPSPNSAYKKEARYYNVWYQWYYIPAFSSAGPGSIPTSDFDLQKQYIYKFGKLQDQMREGDDQRYARGPMVLWRTHKPSWTDIRERYMPTIRLLWLKFQNEVINDIPHGMAWAEEALTEMMDVVDEAERDGKDSNMEIMRRFKQTGHGIFKFMRSEDGARIAPFQETKFNFLQSARDKLVLIMDIYAMMVQSMGTNEIAEGMAPKPRQSFGGIQLAMEASNNATYFIEKAYTDIYTELGYRLINYFKDVVMHGPEERLKEFQDIVGNAQAWALEAIKDIPWRNLGVTVDATNTVDQNIFINELALRMAQGPNPMITPDEAIGLTFVQNVKYKYALLRLRMKRRARQQEIQRQQLEQIAMQAEAARADFELAKINAKSEGTMANTELEKRYEERLLVLESQMKFQQQQAIKNQIKDNHIEENAATAEIQLSADAQKSLI